MLMAYKKCAAHGAVWMMTAVAVMLVSTLAIFHVGPAIEASLFPVYSSIEGTIVKQTPEALDLIIQGVKVRDCEIKTVLGETKIQEHWVRAKAQLLKADDTTEENIPMNSPFVRLVHLVPGGAAAGVDISHRCHPFWASHQHISYNLTGDGSIK